MTTRSASELWTALEDMAIEREIDDEMEAVLAMTPEERRRELVEAGFDLERLHAQADALWTKMGLEPAAVVVPGAASAVLLLPKRRRLAVALPLAAALAAGVALLVEASMPSPLVGTPRPSESPPVRAKKLRDEARDACAARRWQTCIDDLNEAKRLDPEGDESPEVQAMRRSVSEPAGGP